MQANTKPTADDGAPVSEDPAQMKINSQLVDYSTPVRTSAMATAHPSAPLGRHALGLRPPPGTPDRTASASSSSSLALTPSSPSS